MSAGDLYLTELRAAKETTPGTAITTMTRRLYGDEVSFSPNVDVEPIRAQTGTRTNVVGIRKGPFQVTGSLTAGIAPSEMVEWFDLAINGTPTVSTPMGGTLTRDRVYLPGTLASATFEYNDAALIYRVAGARINTWTLDVDPTGDASFSAEFFATNHVTIGAMTGTVTQRTPDFLSGWQGTFEMALFGSSTYTTFNDLVMGASFTMNNNLDRVYTLRNTQAAKRVSVGLMDASATMTFDAADAQAATELINWRTDVKKVLRLTLVSQTAIEGALFPSVIIEMPGAWSAPDLAGTTQNVRSYSFPLQYVLDSNLGGGIKVTVRANRPATGANSPWLD